MGNDTIWEGSLDNSAEIIWCCNPLFCKLGLFDCQDDGALKCCWETLSYILPPSFPILYPISHIFMLSFFCFVHCFFVRIKKTVILLNYSHFFLQNPFGEFSHLVSMKWKLFQELSTKLKALHEVAVCKIIIAHNNQHAFRRDCVFCCFIERRWVRKTFGMRLYIVFWNDNDDDRIVLNMLHGWQLGEAASQHIYFVTRVLVPYGLLM